MHTTNSSTRRWSAFAVLLVGAFLPPLDFFIVNVALPSIQSTLHTSAAELQLVISGYAAAYAVFLITGGRLGDLFGRRRIFLIGVTGFGMTSVICGLASSAAILILGRVAQGLSAAAMAPQGLASIHALFPEKERARALGLYGAAVGLAAVAAQALGGALISADILHLEWRVVFLINLPVVVAVLIFGLPLLPDVRGDSPAPVDRIGVLLCALTLGLLIVPLVEGRELDWPWWACAMLIACPVAGAGFCRYEVAYARRGGVPLISVELIRRPGLMSGLTGVLFFYVVSAFFLTFSVYLQAGLGMSPFETGLVFLPFGVGAFVGPLTTPLAIRLFGDRVPAIGMMLEVAGCALLAALVSSAPGQMPAPFPLIGAVALLGFGQGWALPTLVRSVINRAPATGSGMIAGITNSALQISAALGVAVIGGVFFGVAGTSPDAVTLAGALVVAMMCVGGSLTVSAVLSIVASRSSIQAAARTAPR
ncbi:MULTISPECIES: MFS transporter [unclassified Caballeronia]|uniref:MFS transporter n=1 Tax=unclassified Caballeronia TaxID=2646786 RepID=UPI002861B4B8|nr:MULTISPECIES: MFS transporter [unclassified Caballeronia]MDR5740546.1 MFS transporter [Caballeronia sp. LZ016]MDR5808933.1 MFS transporter [Caballeronia sp. LZ019]